MVKIAIEKHHQGKVFVKSKLNEGSTFGFWLPLEEDDVKEISLKELKDRTLNSQEFKEEKTNSYQEYKIEKIEDYSKKAELDAKFIGQDLNAISKNTKAIQEESESKLFFEEIKQDDNIISAQKETKEDSEEWEISFEVRD